MKKLDILFIVTVACIICGLMLFAISLIFNRDRFLLYSIISLGLGLILVVVGGIKEMVQKKIKG